MKNKKCMCIDGSVLLKWLFYRRETVVINVSGYEGLSGGVALTVDGKILPILTVDG